MNKFILTFIILLFSISNSFSQSDYTTGRSTQLYWTHRPDIADSCYEFTFLNDMPIFPFVPCAVSIQLQYFNDCNFGKYYIFDSVNQTKIHNPLSATLVRQTPQKGIVDTICGNFPPLNIGGNSANFWVRAKTSPLRRRVVYKGLAYLPEGCNKWWFFTTTSGGGPDGQITYYPNGTLEDMSVFYPMLDKSNIDSIGYDNYTQHSRTFGISDQNILCRNLNNESKMGNSSIRFVNPPLTYCSKNQKIEYCPGPLDPDGDSIVILITDILKNDVGNFWSYQDSAGNNSNHFYTFDSYYAPLPGQTGPNPIRYNPINNPFDTDSTFVLDNSTGRTTFKAKREMFVTLMYVAKEYRGAVVTPFHQYRQVYTFPFYIESCAPVGVANAVKAVAFTIVPNPAADKTEIRCSETFTSVEILNTFSEVVFKRRKIDATNNIEVNTIDWPEGIYLVTIDGRYSSKLVIHK